jgi:hypothetical protein
MFTKIRTVAALKMHHLIDNYAPTPPLFPLNYYSEKLIYIESLEFYKSKQIKGWQIDFFPISGSLLSHILKNLKIIYLSIYFFWQKKPEKGA